MVQNSLCIFEAMKQLISSHKENYGKTYGILVIIALIFFALIGMAWFGAFLFLGKFVFEAFVMMIIFSVQLFLRNKLVNLMLGIIAMLFSIWQLMDSAKLYPLMNDNLLYKNIFIINITVFSIGIIMAGLLMFSFLHAFKQSEKNNA